jgi:hypothetical protein
MASERTSRPGRTGFADKANSLAPEALTAEARPSRSAGARVGD